MYQQSSYFSSNMGFADWNLQTLLKMNDITHDVQQHLATVYATLAATIIAASGGVLLDIQYNLGGLLTFIGSIGLCIYISMVDQREVTKRFGLLMLFGMFNGMNIGSLVFLVLQVDPSILVTAFLATTVIFLCFTGSALLANRRQYLYLGAILSSGISCLFMISLVNIFFASTALWTAHLYLGLLIFCGYVLFDTQMIIEKASFGDKDYIMHTQQLFIDFVAIFVRICIILLRNTEKKEKRRSRE